MPRTSQVDRGRAAPVPSIAPIRPDAARENWCCVCCVGAAEEAAPRCAELDGLSLA
jgi:hypothetical protein